MTTIIGIGFSANPDPAEAFKEACIETKRQTNLPSVDLALTFFTSGYAIPGSIDIIHRILQPAHLAGATTPAIIVNGRAEPHGVAILGICSDEIKFGTAMLDHLSFANLRDAGLKLARAAMTDSAAPHRQGLLTLINNSLANHSTVLQGLQEAVGRVFTLAGGVCCDNHLERASLLHQNALSSDGMLGILFGGTAPIVVAARHGRKPLGKPRTVDDAHGNMIKLIDHKPAISLYQEYFPGETKNPEAEQINRIGLLYPLGIRTGRPKEYLLRHPIKALPDGSIVCQAEIPIGSSIHLMIGEKDDCLQAARDAATEVRDQLGGRTPKLIIVLESLARQKLLGRASVQTINIIKETFGLTVPVFGMYTYGEIAPLGPATESRTTQVQNATIVIMAIG
ncbi:MAG: hypothetical protein HGA80_06985 [Candidatus Omnitrophica bacterium]|nr:hypothetical protein [Candidatus Omnitrophota bacterium]